MQLLRAINRLSIPPISVEGNETISEESEWTILIKQRNHVEWYVDKTGLFEDHFIIEGIEGYLNTQNVQYRKLDGTLVSRKALIKTRPNKI
jgi:hypothetical protein